MNMLIAKMFDADGILIGSPTYYSNVTAEVKALIDRSGFVAGANFTYAAINFFFGITEMIIPGSTYWNMSLALSSGDLQKDEEGIGTLQNLGKNMVWLLKKTGVYVKKYGKNAV